MGDDVATLREVFENACDEIGCAYDNEALLLAIRALKRAAPPASPEAKALAERIAGLSKRVATHERNDATPIVALCIAILKALRASAGKG
jgi:hypothetical protein